jgi:cold shock CspA family protein
MSERFFGELKFYDRRRSIGYITPLAPGTPDVFLSPAEWQAAGCPDPGARVSFAIIHVTMGGHARTGLNGPENA